MSLVVWLPLTGHLNNQGLDDSAFTNYSATVDNSGKLGKCYTFNNTAITAHPDVSQFGNNFSFCCWVYFANTTSAQYIFHLGSTGTWPSKYSILQDYGGTLVYHIHGVECKTSISISNYINTWMHLALTYDGSTAKIYINGSQVISESRSTQSFTAGNNLAIGSRINNSSATSFAYGIQSGKLNDVRLYNHTLTSEEVREISKGLMVHYPMTGGWRGCDNLVQDSYIDITSSNYGFGVKKFQITEGKTYTVSARGYISDAAVSSGTHLAVYFYKSDWSYCPSILEIYSTAPETKFATFTATQTTTMTISSYSFKSQGHSGDPVTCIWYKVEEADKPTKWMPNSADTAYTTMGYNNNIEYDTSGYLHNGTINGNVSYSSDTPIYDVSTLITDGRSNYIYAPITIGDGTAITMNAWVKSLSGQTGFSDYHIVLCIDGGYFEFSIPTTGKFRQGFYINNTRKVDDYGTVNLLDTNWHMLTATFDGTSIKRYVDGTLVDTTSASGTLSTGLKTLYIGKYNTNQYGDRNLLTSDVRVYATALTQDDITNLYKHRKI